MFIQYTGENVSGEGEVARFDGTFRNVTRETGRRLRAEEPFEQGHQRPDRT